MRKTGILGGTFDPVHNGHMIIARAALEQYGLDEVLLMTGGNPPHKSGADITPARVRHEMVKLAAEGEPGLIPFGYEVDKKTYSYTAKTLTELRKANPDTEYYFIIGEDSLLNIMTWYKPEIIAKSCVLLVFPRGERTALDSLIDTRKAELGADIRPINSACFGISSTDLRRRAAAGQSLRYFVPDKVAEYIARNRLYE